MRPEPSLTLLGALQILGDAGLPGIDRLDTVLGEPVIGSYGHAGPPAHVTIRDTLLGWLEPGNSTTTSLTAAIAGLPNVVSAARGARRHRLVTSAHTVIAAASFFEALAGGAGGRLLADEYRRRLSVPGKSELQQLRGFLHRAEVPAPSITRGFAENASAVTGWLAELAGRTQPLFGGLTGYPFFDATAVAANASRRYLAHYLDVSTTVPELVVWLHIDHRATELDHLATLLRRRTPTGRHVSDLGRLIHQANNARAWEPVGAQAAAGQDGDNAFPPLAATFIVPGYRAERTDGRSRISEEKWWRRAPPLDDLESIVTNHLRSPGATRQPTLVLGGPGAGKSALLTMIAVWLPPGGYTVIRVPLRAVDPSATVLAQIEQSLAATAYGPVTWLHLIEQTGGTLPVILVDGLDEMMQATGAARSDYLVDIAQFQQTEHDAGRPVAVIVTSRTVMASHVRVPAHSLVLRLDPFSDDKIASWLSAWNTASLSTIGARRYRPLTMPEVTRYGELARTPLILTMLAMNAAHGELPAPTGEVAASYDWLIQSFVRRELASGGASGAVQDDHRAVSTEMYRLSMVAFAAFNRGRDWATEDEINTDLSALSPAPPAPGYPGFGRLLDQAASLTGRFFFSVGTHDNRSAVASRTYQFLHVSLRDYLVALTIHESLAEAAEGWRHHSARRYQPDAQSPYALLSFELLHTRRTALDFLISFAASRSGNPENLVAVLTNWFDAAEHGAGSRFEQYVPQSLARPVRQARYAANILTITDIYTDRQTADVLRRRWQERIGNLSATALELLSPRRLAPSIVVTYVASDRAWAQWAAWHLETAGCRVTLDAWEVRAGDNFISRLQKSIEPGVRVLLIASANLYRSAGSSAEWNSPLVGETGLTVVRVDAQNLPPQFVSVALVDVNGLGPDDARRKLIQTVTGDLPRDELPRFPGTDEAVAAPLEPVHRLSIMHAPDDVMYAELLFEALNRPDMAWLPTLFSTATGDLQSPRLDVLGGDLTLVVVTPGLLSSGYLQSVEMQEIRRRHEERRHGIVPVIARHAAWENGWFGRMTPLPPGGRPISAHDSRDETIKQVVEGVRLLAKALSAPGPEPEAIHRPHGDLVRLEEVFLPAGVPQLTFVEPETFKKLQLALRQPGIGVIIEGPSGIGKTTLLRQAAARSDLREPMRILQASNQRDAEAIQKLADGHQGVVAVDDFHRLAAATRTMLVNYAKALADGESTAKLVLVGIPHAAGDLVPIPPDLANRIRVFRPAPVSASVILQMIAKGEAALNIQFTIREEIAVSAAGSLLTAQTLCNQLAGMANVSSTVERRRIIDGDLADARAEVFGALRLKYETTVHRFTQLDGEDQTVCIDLLLRLAGTDDGILRLDDLRNDPRLRATVTRVFLSEVAEALSADEQIAQHLFLDRAGRRLIADDPQFLFYLRHLGRDALLERAGKKPQTARDQVFICYSREDKKWLDRVTKHLDPWSGRVDIWSDERIAPGELWEDEIATALHRTAVAILLVSADMIASPFVKREELPRLYAAAETGGCRIIPLLVRPSAFAHIPQLNRFQAANPRGRSLAELPEHEAEIVLAMLAKDVAEMFKEG
ncbi:TIR domain-containing protein [Winogradskya consettensis]|uniref:TIR domain-containing protein n=1 Tax=Winogradskya consettensis TaxID=113560 RepID=UPI001BB323EC|nr:TIR domain-containing protein [Actinoplanes consettensis]